MAVFYQGRPITLGTLGLLRNDIPLTVGVDGVLEPLFITVEADLTLGGSAGVTTSLGHSATGIIILGGSVPITIAIGGNFVFDYEPSALGTVTLSGDALVVARENGVLSVDYKPLGGEVISGTSTVGIKMNYFTAGGLLTGGDALIKFYANNSWIAEGGLVTGGEALVTYYQNKVYVGSGGLVTGGTAGVDTSISTEGDRGGKGLPIHKRDLRPQRHVHYYTAEALREKKVINTDFGFVLKGRGVIAFTGAADTLFIPAKYQFIKSLPRLPKPELVPDSEFLNLYKEWEKRHPTTKYRYEATGGLQLTGVSKEEYFDFQNFIIMHDDELIIADIMATDHNPFLTTSYDLKLSRQRKDDDDLLEILELF